MFPLLYLIFIIFSFSTTVIKAAECQFDTNKLPANTPLPLDFRTKDILYPPYGSRLIVLNTGGVIELTCPGSGFIQIDKTSTQQQIVQATCQSGSKFAINGNIVDISVVVCSKRITSIARYTGARCWNIGREVEIGLQIPKGKWIQLMTTCFDDVQKNVLYSHHTLTKLIGNAVTGGTEPNWSEEISYNLGIKVSDIYPKDIQRVTINGQVGLPDQDEKYVKKSGDRYIAKGHLAPRKDFMYNALQMQTFHYINSAPQWQCFNAKNWLYLERNLRQYASNKFVDLQVYTGTYEVSTLPQKGTRRDISLYLFVRNQYAAMPIPELFWKVVYDPLNKAGIAVLGVNNPYQTDVTKSIICNDIADQLTWITFKRKILPSGYIYACTIDDLRKSIPNLPQFDVRSILN